MGVRATPALPPVEVCARDFMGLPEELSPPRLREHFIATNEILQARNIVHVCASWGVELVWRGQRGHTISFLRRTCNYFFYTFLFCLRAVCAREEFEGVHAERTGDLLKRLNSVIQPAILHPVDRDLAHMCLVRQPDLCQARALLAESPHALSYIGL
jgi:hypothetical protein